MPAAPLVEGRDYYVENGLLVFTEHYLRQRGHCCQSGCRHCPYGFTRAGAAVSPADPPCPSTPGSANCP